MVKWVPWFGPAHPADAAQAQQSPGLTGKAFLHSKLWGGYKNPSQPSKTNIRISSSSNVTQITVSFYGSCHVWLITQPPKEHIVTKRILIIDDEQGFCDVLQDVLEDQGYQVDAPRQLASAISKALLGHHHLIILDLRMPGIDGLDIARLFRRKRLQTPILVLLGYITQEVPSILEDLGIRHMLPKPSGVTTMCKAVATAMA
jgi:CheY-like chemotaxis protein